MKFFCLVHSNNWPFQSKDGTVNLYTEELA